MKKIIGLMLALVICVLGLVSCDSEKMGTGASDYLDRSVNGRTVSYIEACVENYGKFVILLDHSSAPKTALHFRQLVYQKFYDGLTFHRVTNNILQGGCPNGDGTGNIVSTVEGEFSDNGFLTNDLRHKRGVISMARGNDYDSASCQFFICTESNYRYDGQYAPFGYIVEGMSVIDDIYNQTVIYGDDSNYGTIMIKSYQPKIKYMKILEDWDH